MASTFNNGTTMTVISKLRNFAQHADSDTCLCREQQKISERIHPCGDPVENI